MIVYLHGRGLTKATSPASVLAKLAPQAFFPELGPEFLALPFSDQLPKIREWIAGAELVIAHSYAAWLTVAALEEKGSNRPRLLFLAPVLSRGPIGGLWSAPPREKRVRQALGLDLLGKEPSVQINLIVCDQEDPTLNLDDLKELEALGTSLRFIEGAGHRFDAKQDELSEVLRPFL